MKSVDDLSQAEAAALLSVNARTLRDLPVPRLPSGGYSGPALVAWARNRAAVTGAVPASDLDKLDIAVGWTTWPFDAAMPALVAWMTDCRRKYGPEFAHRFFDALLDRWRDGSEPATDRAAERAQRERQEAAHEDAERNFRFIAVCPECKRIRRKLAWVFGEVPDDHIESPVTCPNCKGIAS